MVRNGSQALLTVDSDLNSLDNTTHTSIFKKNFFYADGS